MRAAFERMGARTPGLRLECRQRHPARPRPGLFVCGDRGRRLPWPRALVAGGSSLMDDDAAFALAAELEGHPDNVAPAFYGGFTIAYRDVTGFRATSVAVDPRVQRGRLRAAGRGRDRAGPRAAPRRGPARGRCRECGSCRAPRRCPDPGPRSPARRDRGLAAPGLPGAGDAGDSRPRPQAARRGPSGGGVRCRPERARLHHRGAAGGGRGTVSGGVAGIGDLASTRTASGSRSPATRRNSGVLSCVEATTSSMNP